ncbi:MAG TPA: 23S rRNA (adenine(2503)-C(2))-methyltransferase RlmN, partial [Brevundimonas sp.]|nr:23S rRNA (adenine(2503)-C(2))-methyltransferase RlmN [Brevundimonas sp.]
MSITLDLSRAQPATAAPVNLSGLTREGLRQALIDADICPPEKAKMRASQVWGWIHHFGVTDFAAMSNVAKDTRERLAAAFTLARPEIVERQVSNDGTRKWLIRTAPGIEVEAVYIPDVGRAGALCVSSQVGCTLNCRFCHTGTMRLVRNLTPGEIVGQVMLARDTLGEWPKGSMAGLDEVEDSAEYTSDGRLLTNIVLMGMGEPLYNFDNVRDAMKLVMDGDGLALSKRRITLSTSGVVPMMERCGEEIGVNLAVSLHAVRKDIRD